MYISTSRRNINTPFQVLRTAFFDEYNFVLIVTNVKSKGFSRHTGNVCVTIVLQQNWTKINLTVSTTCRSTTSYLGENVWHKNKVPRDFFKMSKRKTQTYLIFTFVLEGDLFQSIFVIPEKRCPFPHQFRVWYPHLCTLKFNSINFKIVNKHKFLTRINICIRFKHHVSITHLFPLSNFQFGNFQKSQLLRQNEYLNDNIER